MSACSHSTQDLTARPTSVAVAHVALDEDAVGRIAAEEFMKRDVSGDLLCVIHEPTNRGLEQRCDSLDETYTNGEVHAAPSRR